MPVIRANRFVACDFAGFGIDSIDPYCGTEFGFRPRGYQIAVRVVNGLTFVDERIEAGTPIVWSAGPGDVRLFTAIAANDGASNPQTNNLPQPARHEKLMTSPLAFTLP